MEDIIMPHALIVGAGEGFSASLARLLAREGYGIALAARNTAKLAALAEEVKATTHACDAQDRAQVEALFKALPENDVVVYNPSYRIRGAFTELDPDEVQKTLQVTAFGAFLVAQQAARRMVPKGRGCIVLTGASAGVKGYPQSAPFAMGKFALRGMAQSMARELHPKGVHVAHIVIDGGIRSARRPEAGEATLLDPDAIAESALHLIRQPKSAWSWEIEVRPWVEAF
jgi:NAD(P)-dependent dehydrogenase (short-subunit alcohol dehydrogenase family)